MNGMRRVLLAATAVLLVLCAAPAANAGDLASGWPEAVTMRPLGWLEGLMERFAEWFAGGEGERFRAVVQTTGSCADPLGNPIACSNGTGPAVPVPTTDEGCGMDPLGQPCRP